MSARGTGGRIVVVGSINTDLVVTADRLPQPGETLTGRSFATYQGGKGANQAVAAARLGATVVMIGKVGTDALGAESLRQLQAQGVDCTYVAEEPGDSGVAVISVGAGGQNSIVVVPGANAQVSPAFVAAQREVLAGAALVLAQLEIPLESVMALARLCEELGVPLMLDPAPAQALPLELLQRCTWFTPNETEARFYAQPAEDTPEATSAALRALGLQGLVLKRGEHGAYLDQPDSPPVRVEPVRVQAVDTVAAGDTFNGALAFALVQGQSLEEVGRFAAAAAAIAVTRVGAQASMPALAEVQAMLDRKR
jgi:ribokinase